MPSPKAVALMEDQNEWLTWDQAVLVVRLAKVGPRPWVVLADWCGQGLIDTMAALVTGAGEVQRNVELDATLWELCGRNTGLVDAFDGSIQWTLSDEAAQGQTKCVVSGTRFRKDQVLAMVSHIKPSEIEAALQVDGCWLEGRKTEAAPPAPAVASSPRGRGGRGLSEHWPLFVAELVLWVEEANDDPGLLTPTKLIAKLNDRLAEKGIEQMPPSTAEATAKAVLAALQKRD
jgi:hypothetical protein